MTPTTHNKHRRQVAAAIRLVRAGSDGRITLGDLAAAAGSSAFHFDRVFRRMTGMGAGRYVRWVRLNAAAVAVVGSDRRIVDVALAAGYANHESFSRAFRLQFGLSPHAYRKRNRTGRQPGQEITMKTLGVSFGHVKIPVTDFARGTAFYRDVLGLAEEFAVEQYAVGDVAVCLFVVGRSSFPADDDALGGHTARAGIDTGIQLSVTDARAAHAAIAGRGGRVGQIHVSDDGTIGFGVADPDGNKIHIAQAT